MNIRPFLFGLIASLLLLSIFALITSAISGIEFMLNQFFLFWYFLLLLAIGFGTQIAIYQMIKMKMHAGAPSSTLVATTGTTSTIAMISCCSHYLLNLLPILATTGIASTTIVLIGKYQVQIFLFGIILNIFGIFIMWNKFRYL